VPSDLVALSNMPIVDEKVEGHVKTVFYQESPIMSTYLVAVVVGLFDYVEDHTSDGKVTDNCSSLLRTAVYLVISVESLVHKESLLIPSVLSNCLYICYILCRSKGAGILSSREAKSGKICPRCCCQDACIIPRVCSYQSSLHLLVLLHSEHL